MTIYIFLSQIGILLLNCNCFIVCIDNSKIVLLQSLEYIDYYILFVYIFQHGFNLTWDFNDSIKSILFECANDSIMKGRGIYEPTKMWNTLFRRITHQKRIIVKYGMMKSLGQVKMNSNHIPREFSNLYKFNFTSDFC